jgi:hypothetical protein
MSTNAAIMRRLDALEARLAPPAVDDGALERLIAEMDIVAARLRASKDWTEPTPEENAAYWREFEAFMATLA